MGDRHSHFLSLTGRKTGDKQAVMALGVLLEWNSWLVICVCVCCGGIRLAVGSSLKHSAHTHTQLNTHNQSRSQMVQP